MLENLESRGAQRGGEGWDQEPGSAEACRKAAASFRAALMPEGLAKLGARVLEILPQEGANGMALIRAAEEIRAAAYSLGLLPNND